MCQRATLTKDDAAVLLDRSDTYWNVMQQESAFIPRGQMSRLPPSLYRITSTLKDLTAVDVPQRYRAWAALNFFWLSPPCSYRRIIDCTAQTYTDDIRCLAMRTIARQNAITSIPGMEQIGEAVFQWCEDSPLPEKRNEKAPIILRPLSSFKLPRKHDWYRQQLKKLWVDCIGVDRVESLTTSIDAAQNGLLDTQPDVRIVALQVLEQCWRHKLPSYIEEILKMARTDCSDRVRSASMGTLASLYAYEDCPEIEAAFFTGFCDEDETEGVKRSIYDAMLTIRGIPYSVLPDSIREEHDDWRGDCDLAFVRSFAEEGKQ